MERESGCSRQPSHAPALRRISCMASLTGVSSLKLMSDPPPPKMNKRMCWNKNDQLINLDMLIHFLGTLAPSSRCDMSPKSLFWTPQLGPSQQIPRKSPPMCWNQSSNILKTWKLTFSLENRWSNVGHWCPLHPRNRIKSHASAANTHTIIIQQRHSTRDILKLSHAHQMTPGEVANAPSNVGQGQWYDYDHLVSLKLLAWLCLHLW